MSTNENENAKDKAKDKASDPIKEIEALADGLDIAKVVELVRIA
eukprot:CAMPEP_0201580004 /NCGR_PEP_ID=MMETSP0190_2-20130828/31038_1 /ASSEMBLY_ACC=CAM_ASM_000263 /TAXON_ID=37353 /ORGANISM="Rosalina sp." /LENGTH=43 /DNA_ID= /DNA_START= /DNA_END= /DNA_ORIENTATION=